MATWVPMALAIISLLGSLGVAWFARDQALRAKRIETEASPYSALAARVVELETGRTADQNKISELARKLAQLEAEREGDQRTIGHLSSRVLHLEEENREYRLYIRSMITWIRLQNLDVKHPDPPFELEN